MGEARARLARELRWLYQAAGRPSCPRLTDLARRQRPPVRLTLATLSAWLSGTAVPGDPAAFRFLVQVLEDRVWQRGPVVPYWPLGWREWERMRQAATAERGAPGPPGPRPRWAGPRWRRLGGAVVAVAAAVTSTAVLGHVPRAAGGPPVIAFADGLVVAADRLPGAVPWYVARRVSGPAACPSSWICFYQYDDFNRRSPGWMILAHEPRTGGDCYDFAPPYDKAMSSWINNTPFAAAWHPAHHDHGPPYRMSPHARAAHLGGAARTASSFRMDAARPGRLPDGRYLDGGTGVDGPPPAARTHST
ncbi:peptidase inhibitor family I36 protein [Nonomuraea sp. NPDC050783]|uniref:peptidase inhibitor family I36 protein n=1 Tax=Nonomuraea sp. NPDC050783 TaxID=3154634 RepID=UPI00346591CB